MTPFVHRNQNNNYHSTKITCTGLLLYNNHFEKSHDLSGFQQYEHHYLSIFWSWLPHYSRHSPRLTPQTFALQWNNHYPTASTQSLIFQSTFMITSVIIPPLQSTKYFAQSLSYNAWVKFLLLYREDTQFTQNRTFRFPAYGSPYLRLWNHVNFDLQISL